MSAICEQHLPVLKNLLQFLGANSWTKIADANNLPELDIIKIYGATIYSWYHDNVDQFVETIHKLIKPFEV